MVNGTLLVQMLNFYIGYLILKYVLLKPVLVIIMQQEEKEQQLNHSIVDLKKKVAAQEEQKKRAWRECMQTLSLLKPKLGVPGLHQKRVMPRVSETIIDAKTTQESVDVLVQQVCTHVARESKV